MEQTHERFAKELREVIRRGDEELLGEFYCDEEVRKDADISLERLSSRVTE